RTRPRQIQRSKLGQHHPRRAATRDCDDNGRLLAKGACHRISDRAGGRTRTEFTVLVAVDEQLFVRSLCSAFQSQSVPRNPPAGRCASISVSGSVSSSVSGDVRPINGLRNATTANTILSYMVRAVTDGVPQVP